MAQGVIEGGVTKNKAVNLTGDLDRYGGRDINPDVTTNGHRFETHPGNALNAPTIDGSRDPADWGANVIIGGALHASWQRLGSLQLAVDILFAIDERMGPEGRALWGRALDEIFADPAIGYAAMVANVDAWAAADPGGDEGVTNTLDTDRAFKRLQAKFFAGQTYNQIKTTLTSYSRETWDGAETQVVEEYP